MSQITITTDSEDLQNRLISFGQAYSAITDLELEADTDIDLANEISGALIDKLLEETEESAQNPAPEPLKDPAGYVIRSNRTLLAATRTLFSSNAAAIKHIQDNFARDVHVNYVVAPVYF
jgi:hypothetical protein